MPHKELADTWQAFLPPVARPFGAVGRPVLLRIAELYDDEEEREKLRR